MRFPGFCRDCLAGQPAGLRRCRACGSPRLLYHGELYDLTLAHIDCDAFYAAIEKRDDPSLRDKPLIVGGGHRGVVSTCCYIARISGVRSAMPMFKARKLCPEAVVVPPNMAKYREVGEQVRTLMLGLTPLVEPVSIDEAFLDLTGTERLHHMSPARALNRLALKIEREIGITVYRLVVIRQGVIAASRGGKIKTIVQSVAISFALFPLWTIFGDWIFWVNGILMTAAVVLTVVTGFDYLWQAYRGRRATRAGS